MGTCVRSCVGRCSQIHSDDEYGTEFFSGTTCSWVHPPTVLLFEQLCCDGVTLPGTLERIRPCQLEMEQVLMMTTGCKSTLSRKARGRTKANTKTRKEIARTTQATRAIQNCDRTGHWTKDFWRPGGGAHDNSTSNNHNTQKGKNHKKGRSKSKYVDVVETNQPSEAASTVSYPSQTPSTLGALSCNPDGEQKGWIMGATVNSVSSTRRQAGAECLPLESGAQLHVCPLKYIQDKKYRCQILESAQQVELDSNMTEDDW